MSRLARRPTAIVALIVAAGVIGGAAFAAQKSSRHIATTGVIQACVKDNGQPRIVGSLAECKKNDQGISWNIIGPQGPQGIQGVPGISVTTTSLAAGDVNCATGGIRVTSANGITYVCNGPKGEAGVSVTTQTVAVGDVNCPTGGVHITSASGVAFVCNGAKGDKGEQGAQGPTGPQGPQGPAGASAGSLTSPNGTFHVDITDHGIFLRGPGGTIYVDRFNANTSSNPNFER